MMQIRVSGSPASPNQRDGQETLNREASKKLMEVNYFVWFLERDSVENWS